MPLSSHTSQADLWDVHIITWTGALVLRKCFCDKPPPFVFVDSKTFLAGGCGFANPVRSRTHTCKHPRPLPLARIRVRSNFNAASGKLGHTVTLAPVVVAGRCLAWLWVGEAVMTWAGQIGKPHLERDRGRSAEPQMGETGELTCVCVCVLAGFLWCKVMTG